MQVEVVGHDRRADDAERQVEHVRVGDDLRRRREAANHLPPIGIGHGDLHDEADGDDAEQRDDEGLDPTEALVLQIKDQEHVGGGDDDADLQRNPEQQVEADRRPDDLRQIGGADGDLGQEPERVGKRPRIGVAAGLGEVAAGGDRHPGAQVLQDDRHDVGEEGDEEQRVAELGASGEGRRPVAGVHIADGNEVAGAEERHQLAPHRAVRGDRDGPVHLGQGRIPPAPPPVGQGAARCEIHRPHGLSRCCCKLIATRTGK